MIWVKVLSYNYWQRIIDFGNGAPLDNVFITFERTTDKIGIEFFKNTEKEKKTSSKSIALNEWVHLTVTSSGNNVILYLDGVEEFSFTAEISDVVRTKNYLGKSNWESDSNVHAIFDEMKIFNRELTIDEILAEKEKKQPYKLIEIEF